jgi:hypothetical protein
MSAGISVALTAVFRSFPQTDQTNSKDVHEQATIAYFKVFLNSIFAYHPIIQRYTEDAQRRETGD